MIRPVSEPVPAQRPVATLLYADAAGRSRFLVAGLSRLGRSWTVVHTPLAAVIRLEDTTVAVNAALVPLQDVGFDISAFFELLRDEYPRVRRIAFAQRDPKRQGSGSTHSCPHDVILWSPWDRANYLKILGDALDGRPSRESPIRSR